MNTSTMENEQMKIHIESRKKVLQELQQVYTKNSYRPTSNLDSSTCNVPETKGESYSPVVEDLLMEMNRKRLKKSDENSNRDCYRCRHFSNIPQNLSEACDRVSNCTEKFVDDLSFVQAVVWLKSATMFMKDISMEQFHLAFHKQWNNNRDKGKDSECCYRDSVSEVQGRDNENSINPLGTNEKSTISDRDSEYASSIDLFCNVNPNKRDISRSNYQQRTKEEDFTRNNSCLSIIPPQSPERYFSDSTRHSRTLNNCIISDSDRGSSSSSDIFKDSLESQDIARDEKRNKSFEGNGFHTDEMIELFSLTSRSSEEYLPRKTALEKSDLSVSSDDDSSDVTMFDEDRQSVNHLPNDESKRASVSNTRITTECTQSPDSNSPNKSPAAPLNRVGTTTPLQRDSAYDTCSLSAEYCVFENEDIDIFTSQRVDGITPYQREDSCSDRDDLEFLTIDMTGKDWISGRDSQPSLSPMKSSLNKGNDEDVCSIKTEHSICQDAVVCHRNEYSQGIEYLIQDTKCKGTCGKKRQLDCVDEADCMIVENKEERKVSSQWLRFTMDALSADDIAFQSVKVILSVFQDERMARQYMRKRCWKDTLEAQAVNAVLDFCDVFEAENKTNACTQEIARTVTNTLDKSMGNTELNKVTIFTHQVSISLELCTSMPVCIEVINYLTAKLKSQGSVLITLIKSKKADVHNIINQLQITFYALSLCLQRYRLASPHKGDNQFEEEIVPPVMDLWKKQLNFEGVIVEDSVQAREQRWLMILDDFTVIATENFPQLAEKSRRLGRILTCK